MNGGDDINRTISRDGDNIDIDEIEVDEVGKDEELTSTKEKELVDEVSASCQSTGKKQKLTKSDIWVHYEILPLGPDNKLRCKCKKCGMRYLCDSSYGTGNLRRHLGKCTRRDTKDIGQLFITSERSSMSLKPQTFDPNKFRELVSAIIVMNNLPFQFV